MITTGGATDGWGVAGSRANRPRVAAFFADFNARFPEEVKQALVAYDNLPSGRYTSVNFNRLANLITRPEGPPDTSDDYCGRLVREVLSPGTRELVVYMCPALKKLYPRVLSSHTAYILAHMRGQMFPRVVELIGASHWDVAEGFYRSSQNASTEDNVADASEFELECLTRCLRELTPLMPVERRHSVMRAIITAGTRGRDGCPGSSGGRCPLYQQRQNKILRIIGTTIRDDVGLAAVAWCAAHFFVDQPFQTKVASWYLFGLDPVDLVGHEWLPMTFVNTDTRAPDRRDTVAVTSYRRRLTELVVECMKHQPISNLVADYLVSREPKQYVRGPTNGERFFASTSW